MDFKENVAVRSEVLSFANRDGVIRHTLKVYDPTNSTEGFNQHAALRRANNGAYILAEKPYSDHLSDNYLTVVLAYYEGQYVTWVFNYETGACNYGHYYAGIFSQAMKDFIERNSEDFLPKVTESKKWRTLKEFAKDIALGDYPAEIIVEHMGEMEDNN